MSVGSGVARMVESSSRSAILWLLEEGTEGALGCGLLSGTSTSHLLTSASLALIATLKNVRWRRVCYAYLTFGFQAASGCGRVDLAKADLNG